MNVNLQDLRLKLAEYKVYDAWQYVNSLNCYLSYMKLSYELINATNEYRKEQITEVNNSIFETAMKTGFASLKESDLDTSIEIGTYKINDTILQQKNTLEFFHYARLSVDILFQIVNAALLGDDAVDVEERRLISKVLRKLDQTQKYPKIVDLLKKNNDNDCFKYLQAVDNYIKHIKTILIKITNNFLFDNHSTFKINRFVYGRIVYEEREAIQQIEDTYTYINDFVEKVLNELYLIIPLVSNTSSRIHEIKLHIQMQELESGAKVDYATFFIDVDDISDLPSEIKVLPLAIKSNKEIYSFDMQFDKIFIRKINTDEIIGCATLKNGLNTNEIYRIYEVNNAQQIDYLNYLLEFKNRDGNYNLNRYAFKELTIVTYK